MNGVELAQLLRGFFPDPRVLYMSGYTDDAIAHHGALEGKVALLSKPFTPDSLSRSVREALDRP